MNKRPSKSSGHLCSSSHYVWSTNATLGKGATGAVYKGLNKITGEQVAVKAFNHLSHLRAPDVQMREFEVLKKVNHVNIVRLLSIEQEQGTENKVLIMELCTGGSLYNILDDPENTFGLQESEFLIVLEHITGGMKHLRDNNIVHRDLKPGNIMKFVELDGRFVYKLTDFGAARELPDDQQFMSLYGTEEYLHPDMYERAVLHKSASKSFGATVDLWSIGVTLYHVATGFLPFRPYGGRRNKETMFHITTRKESGVISGVQLDENGPIEWSNKLPSSCQLSVGLQCLISTLLANLLESDPNKIWSFDQYFQNVTDILSHQIIHVFDMCRGRLLHIYLPLKRDGKTFEKLIHEQTKISPENQMLLYKGKLFRNNTLDSVLTSKLETNPSSPIFLFSTSDNSVLFEDPTFIAHFPTLSSSVSIEQDASAAKMFCSSACCVKRSITNASSCLKLYHSGALCLTEVLRNRMAQAEIALNTSETLVSSTAKTMNVITSSYRFLASVLDIVFSDSMHLMDTTSKQLRDLVVAKEDSMTTVQTQLDGVSQRLRPLISKTLVQHTLWNKWTELSSELTDIDKNVVIASNYVKRMRDSWECLMKNKSLRVLSYNDEQFHLVEKKKIQECNHKLNELYRESVRSCKLAAEALSSWLSSAQSDFRESTHLYDGLTSFQDVFCFHQESLDQTANVYDQELLKVLKKINEEFVDSKSKKNKKPSDESISLIRNQQITKEKSKELLAQKIRELEQTGSELKDGMQQNKLLVARIRSLLLNTFSPGHIEDSSSNFGE